MINVADYFDTNTPQCFAHYTSFGYYYGFRLSVIAGDTSTYKLEIISVRKSNNPEAIFENPKNTSTYYVAADISKDPEEVLEEQIENFISLTGRTPNEKEYEIHWV